MLKNNHNKVGNCKWCSKDIYSSEAYMIVKQEYSCVKCFKNSGHMLPFWGNNERHKVARTAREKNRIQRKRNETV